MCDRALPLISNYPGSVYLFLTPSLRKKSGSQRLHPAAPCPETYCILFIHAYIFHYPIPNNAFFSLTLSISPEDPELFSSTLPGP